MLLFFGLSFTNVARQLWQPFSSMFALVGITCMYIALTLVDQETWFRVAQATMSFMLFLALIGMAPFTTFYAVGVGLFIVVILSAAPQGACALLYSVRCRRLCDCVHLWSGSGANMAVGLRKQRAAVRLTTKHC